MVQILENTNAIDYAIQNDNVAVLAHSCNCFCVQAAGIALYINKKFSTLNYPSEHPNLKGDYTKLGNIEYMEHIVDGRKTPLNVCNMYGQYTPGVDSPFSDIPLDYDALFLCLKKLFKTFEGKEIVIPARIGCGLAGGDWQKVLNKIYDYDKVLNPNTKITICDLGR